MTGYLVKVIHGFKEVVHFSCLMTNNCHLLVKTPGVDLSKSMRQLNGVYTQWFNKKHQRVAHLFQGRVKTVGSYLSGAGVVSLMKWERPGAKWLAIDKYYCNLQSVKR